MIGAKNRAKAGCPSRHQKPAIGALDSFAAKTSNAPLSASGAFSCIKAHSFSLLITAIVSSIAN
ncbi:hypothetical protein [uncultured Varibaculum sp.]|uniref:hypothetical protein n=1 Tax=uncultured Varibaculum sp. TaxID=413896 RepID=UPI00288B885F|nr:hypothetical protein [uncultured Varibaculum sp.]